MIIVIIFLFSFLSALTYAEITLLSTTLPIWAEPLKIILTNAIVGGFGGCTYCLRAIYLNRCVANRWDSNWHVWYFLRPFVSCICGAASYIFLKSGLLVLESGTQPDATDIGFYALAFIAGLNVDKFISKIEDVALAVWGIEKSGSYKKDEKSDKP